MVCEAASPTQASDSLLNISSMESPEEESISELLSVSDGSAFRSVPLVCTSLSSVQSTVSGMKYILIRVFVSGLVISV